MNLGATGFDAVLGSQSPAAVIDQIHDLHVRTHGTFVGILPRERHPLACHLQDLACSPNWGCDGARRLPPLPRGWPGNRAADAGRPR